MAGKVQANDGDLMVFRHRGLWTLGIVNGDASPFFADVWLGDLVMRVPNDGNTYAIPKRSMLPGVGALVGTFWEDDNLMRKALSPYRIK